VSDRCGLLDRCRAGFPPAPGETKTFEEPLETNRYRANEPDVIYQQFDEEMVVIYLPTGAYHSLNDAAGDVLLTLGQTGATLGEVVGILCAKYDAAPETIGSDVTAFLEQLKHESLIVKSNGSPSVAPSAAPSYKAERIPYVAPALQSYQDVQALLMLDPIHDVSAAGWPNLPADATALQSADGVRCRLAGPHVIFERFDDETVAINMFTGSYYTLYGPSQDIFLLMSENPTSAEIHKALTSKYSLEGLDTAGLISEYLKGLATAGLICMEPLRAVVLSEERNLVIQRPGTELPFSELSLQIFTDPKNSAPATALGEMLAAGKRYFRLSANLLYGAAGGEMVMIDRDSGSYYRLNEPASDVFKLLKGVPTLQDLAAALIQKYDVAAREINAAVIIFISNLLRAELASAVSSDQRELASQVSLPVSFEKLAFKGFNIDRHRDLAEVMRPVNRLPTPARAVSADSSERLCGMLHQYFEQIAARFGKADTCFDIAGTRIRLRRAGNGYSELQKAFTHLALRNSEIKTNLTIHVWDCMIPASDYFLAFVLETLHNGWNACCGPRGELQGFHSENISAIYHPGPDVLSVVDAAHGQAYFLKRDDSPFPYWEIGSPFRYILHSYFSTRGYQFVHGAAVGTPESGVLLAGKGGAGKSTTSLLCAKAGLLYAGDDYCLVDPQSAYVHSLYNTGKLGGVEDLERLPDLTGRSSNADGFEHGGKDKGVFFIPDIWPERLSSGFPIRAILVPRISGDRESRLEECAPADALMAMLASTVAQLPLAKQDDCDRLAHLAENLPAYVLHLGTDLEQIPAVVRSVLG
jgi:hypothetical protein